MVHENLIDQLKDLRQNRTTDTAQRIFNSIPATGSNPETDKLAKELKDILFPQEYVSELRNMGINIDKVHYYLSRNKIEITLAIKLPSGKKDIVVRCENGGTGYIRVTNGISGWEKTLQEEAVPETLDKTAMRLRKIIEGLLPASATEGI